MKETPESNEETNEQRNKKTMGAKTMVSKKVQTIKDHEKQSRCNNLENHQ